jgi:hypothetical protein
MRRFFSLAILAAAPFGLAGCVAYPAGPSYGGYYGAPAYYAAPAVSLNYNGGYGGGWHHYRHW